MAQPLPRLTWTKTQNNFSVTATTAAILAAIATELTNAGCTVEQQTVSGTLTALGVKLPGADVADLRVIIAGRSTSETPTMLTPDTYATDRLLVGIVKGITSETLVDWENASPYSGGTFSGYWRHGGATTSMQKLFIIVSDEALIISTEATSGSMPNCHIVAGAFLDPHSEHADACETSGRIYGMNTFAGGWGTSAWSDSTNGFFYHNTTANSGSHFGAWKPRTSTWETLYRALGRTIQAPIPGADNFKIPGGAESVCRPIYVECVSSPRQSYGRIREIFYWHDDSHAKTINKTGPTVAGYTLSGSTATAQDAAFVAAADNRA